MCVAQAQQVAVRLEGDVITADGAVLRGVARGTRLPALPASARHVSTGKGTSLLALGELTRLAVNNYS